MNEKTCKNCDHFKCPMVPTGMMQPVQKKGDGYCTRFPPTGNMVMTQQGPAIMSIVTAVNEDHSCGEFYNG